MRPEIAGVRVAMAGLAVLLLAACSSGGSNGSLPAATSTGPGATLKVITTTTVFADIVHNVGRDRVSVSSIVPAGVGPEDYEPRPEDARKLEGAQLIVSNGVGLDDFLDGLLRSAGSGSTPRLVLGEGIPPVEDNEEPNPHFWLDPSLVSQYYVPRIQAKLGELDPAGAESYRAEAAAYAKSLADLDRDLMANVQTLPAAGRKLVTFHDAFPYLARHYGFELVGVVVENVGQEPTAAELAQLVARVKAAGVRAVFSEAQFSPKLTQTLAQEAGIERVVTTLYDDALGPAPANTYLGLMRYDIEQIVGALK